MDTQQRIKIYQDLVLRYEELDRAIDQLIMEHDGASENMSENAMQQYRDLARQRSEARNEMRILEQMLSIDQDD